MGGCRRRAINTAAPTVPIVNTVDRIKTVDLETSSSSSLFLVYAKTTQRKIPPPMRLKFALFWGHPYLWWVFRSIEIFGSGDVGFSVRLRDRIYPWNSRNSRNQTDNRACGFRDSRRLFQDSRTEPDLAFLLRIHGSRIADLRIGPEKTPGYPCPRIPYQIPLLPAHFPDP